MPILTLSPGLVDVTAPMLTLIPTVLILSPGLVDVTAPAVSVNLGARTLLLMAAAFAVVAPTLRVLTAQRGTTLAALDDLPDVSAPNVLTQTTYELTVGSLPAVTIPALSADLTKRLYMTSRPIFGYAPNGQLPIARDTGVYLSSDLGLTWHDVPLPEFVVQVNISQPIFAERDGHLYLFFADNRGLVARHDTTARTTLMATFTGPAGDVAVARVGWGLAVEPGASQLVLYASGATTGIWRSLDNGVTFALANAGQGAGLGGNAVVCHPVTAGLCYAGGCAEPLTSVPTRGAPLYRSTDSGAHWTLVHTMPVEHGIIRKIALGADPDIVYLCTQLGIFKSLDQGVTVNAIHTGLPDPFDGLAALAVSQSDESILYVAIDIPGTTPPVSQVYKSIDAGATWVLQIALSPGRDGPVLIGGIAIHPTDPDQAAFGTLGPNSLSGVFLTSNGGTSWTIADPAPGQITPKYVIIWGVAYGPGTMMVATTPHAAPSTTLPTKVQIGTETTYGEIHDATVTLPYAATIVTAITDLIIPSVVVGVPAKFPPVHIDMVRHYRTGAIEKIRLSEVQLERMDVRQASGERQITLSGRATHADIARGPQAPRGVPLRSIEQITDEAADFSVTLPGIHTEWQTYDTMMVNGRSLIISAIRYSITNSRRLTVLGTGFTDSAKLDPTETNATAHPRVRQGRVPTRG